MASLVSAEGVFWLPTAWMSTTLAGSYVWEWWRQPSTPVHGVWILSSWNGAIKILTAIPQAGGSCYLLTWHLSQLGLNTSRRKASDFMRSVNTNPNSAAVLIQRENSNFIFFRSGELEVFSSFMIFILQETDNLTLCHETDLSFYYHASYKNGVKFSSPNLFLHLIYILLIYLVPIKC